MSLFERLRNSFPENAHTLTTQYRLNDELLNITNELFYRHHGFQLVSATKEIATQRLSSTEKAFSFIDTSTMEECEEKTTPSGEYFNLLECHLVCQQIQLWLAKSNLAKTDIGVITPYNAQIKEIQASLCEYGITGIEVATVDR